MEKNSPIKEQKITKEIKSFNDEQKSKALDPVLSKNLPIIMPKTATISPSSIANDGKPKFYRGSQILLPSLGALSKKDLEKIEVSIIFKIL